MRICTYSRILLRSNLDMYVVMYVEVGILQYVSVHNYQVNILM